MMIDSCHPDDDDDDDAVLLTKRASNSMLELVCLVRLITCLLYTSPSPRDRQKSRMPSSA